MNIKRITFDPPRRKFNTSAITEKVIKRIVNRFNRQGFQVERDSEWSDLLIIKTKYLRLDYFCDVGEHVYFMLKSKPNTSERDLVNNIIAYIVRSMGSAYKYDSGYTKFIYTSYDTFLSSLKVKSRNKYVK